MSDDTTTPETIDEMTYRHRTEMADLKIRQALERHAAYLAIRKQKEARPKRPVGRPRTKPAASTSRPKQIEWRGTEKLEIQ